MSYVPIAPPHLEEAPEIVHELSQWVYDELAKLSSVLREVEELHAAPLKPYHLQTVYADGTNWNPGSGAGVYYYDAVRLGWYFLG